MKSWRLVATGVVLAGTMLSAAHAEPSEPIVTSSQARSSSVTIYRTPDNGADDLDLNWLGGYALITETRDVDIPAGRATVRFEGVAAGMLPESAIVIGLPVGVREKNLDAGLLSPASLYSRSFGRPVTLRRLNPKTGAMNEERAIIRSAPDGAVILQTVKGFEAADCGPLNEQLVYHDLPSGLSARPRLSVETDAPSTARARLTLSYLAWGFDWRARYILHMRPDGRHADLTAWVSLASSDVTSLPNATAAVVGGKPNFDETRNARPDDGEGELVFHCFAHPSIAPLPAPPSAPEAEDIVVTARRVEESPMDAPVTMKGEDLGDLKLFRMPVPTTVAAHAEKQVALLDHRLITLATLYGGYVQSEGDEDASIIVRMHNITGAGLGMALPAGRIAVFEPHAGQMVLVGAGGLVDRAVGELVDVAIARSPQVHIKSEETGHGDDWETYLVTVTNANSWPIHFEGKIRKDDDETIVSSSAPLTVQGDHRLWVTTIPANGQAVLRYRLKDLPSS